MPKATNLTAKEYNGIKHLIGLGLTDEEIMAITERSVSTMHNIKCSSDFLDYKESMREKNLEYKAKRQQAKAPVEEQVWVAPLQLPETPTVENDDAQRLLLNLATEITELKDSIRYLTEDVSWIRDHAVVQTRSKIFGRG